MKRPKAPPATTTPASSASAKATDGQVLKSTKEHPSGEFVDPNATTEDVMPKFNEKKWGPGLDQDLDEGDSFTITHGKEVFSPVRFHVYEVGPISVTVTLRNGEGLDEAYARARRFLEIAFIAEFQLKQRDFFARLAVSGPEATRGAKK